MLRFVRAPSPSRSRFRFQLVQPFRYSLQIRDDDRMRILRIDADGGFGTPDLSQYRRERILRPIERVVFDHSRLQSRI